jgi:hypothetical protein
VSAIKVRATLLAWSRSRSRSLCGERPAPPSSFPRHERPELCRYRFCCGLRLRVHIRRRKPGRDDAAVSYARRIGDDHRSERLARDIGDGMCEGRNDVCLSLIAEWLYNAASRPAPSPKSREASKICTKALKWIGSVLDCWPGARAMRVSRRHARWHEAL